MDSELLNKIHSTATEHGDTAMLSTLPLDVAALQQSVVSEKAGAVASFIGYTRDNYKGRTVTRLEYEAYIPLALKTMQAILLEARSLPALDDSAREGHAACCLPDADEPVSSTPMEEHSHTPSTIAVTSIAIAHLLGPCPPKTASIVIAVSTPHRAESFFLVSWLLERVKRDVQVWKKEYYSDGTDFTGQDGEHPPVVRATGHRAHEGQISTAGDQRPELPQSLGSQPIVDGVQAVTPGRESPFTWKENFPSSSLTGDGPRP